MDEDPINLLERRIEALELQIFPRNETTNITKTADVTTFLLETQTMITSALSCREAITSLLKHMATINEYLNPDTGVNELEAEAKCYHLLQLYPELKETVQKISTFESLLPFMDSGNISKVTELTGKIEQLAVDSMNTYSECREVTQNVLKSLQEYNEIMLTIKILFAQLENAVSVLENSRKSSLQTQLITEE